MKNGQVVPRLSLALLVLLCASWNGDSEEIPFTVWSINLEGGHERGRIAQVLYGNWRGHTDAGLLGLQEVKAEVLSCRFQGVTLATNVNGAACFAAMMSESYQTDWDYGYGRATYPFGFRDRQGGGNIIGPDWEMVKKTKFNIGHTKYGLQNAGFLRRYLLETHLRHKATSVEVRFYNTHFFPKPKHADTRIKMAKDTLRIMRHRAQPGELLPILVGDFNTSRRLDTGWVADRAIDILDNALERPADLVYENCGGTPWTGIDMVFVGRPSTFPDAIGGYRVKRRWFLDLPSLEYSDHPAVGIDLIAGDQEGLAYDGECDDVELSGTDIVHGIAPVIVPPQLSPPSPPRCDCAPGRVCCVPGHCVDYPTQCYL